MASHRFKQVDVFTNRPLFGNPVAVVLEAEGLDDAEMQRIAAWTNLSETTFVLPPTTPEADYLLRIFHPTGELPFAGHPTVGSAHAVLESGLVRSRTFKMECGAGILPLRTEGEGPERRIFVEAPRASIVHEYGTSLPAIAAALGADVSGSPPPTSVNNGPIWVFCRLESADTVARLKPDMTEVARLSRDFSATGFAVFALTPSAQPEEPDSSAGGEESGVSKARVRIRCFAPAFGVPEDPVTGSANASLPAYLARHGLLGRTGREYVSSQGKELGRDGCVHVRVLDEDGRAEIGGQAVTVIEGEMFL